MRFLWKNWDRMRGEVADVVQAAFLVLPDEKLMLALSFTEPLPPNVTHSMNSCGESRGMWHVCKLRPVGLSEDLVLQGSPRRPGKDWKHEHEGLSFSFPPFFPACHPSLLPSLLPSISLFLQHKSLHPFQGCLISHTALKRSGECPRAIHPLGTHQGQFTLTHFGHS